MAKRVPSLLALLGLVAWAGYQNREKISEFVKSLANDPNSAAGGLIESARKGGLGEIVDHFTQGGEGKTAESASGTQLEKILGADLVDRLVKQTGLSREELLARLSRALPEMVIN